MRNKPFVKYLFTFAVMLLAMVAIPKLPVYAITEDEAADLESTYIIKHSEEWGHTHYINGNTKYLADDKHFGARWDSTTGKLTVMGADAYAVDEDVIDNIVNGKYTVGGKTATALKDIISYLKNGKCSGTKSCAARCSQAVRDGGCKDTCAVSSTDMEKACKGHGWTLQQINSVKSKFNSCTNGIAYVFVKVKCTDSAYKCDSDVWLCLFTPIEGEHQEVIINNGDTHTYKCEICDTVFKTEPHHWGEWEATSAYDRARICLDCDAVDEMHLTPPSESASTGYATYYPDYPSGTIVGASVIRDELTYYPDEFAGWTYPVEKTPSAGYYWSWDPSTGKQNYKHFKKDANYHPNRVPTYTDNSAKNKYTTRAKTALFSGSTEDSSRFWAKYKLTYKAGDSQGSTKAVNVPSPTYTTCHPDSISKGYKTTLTYGKDPKFEIHTTWQTTTVTASSGAGMYRTGYIFKNWKNSTWGGATWGAGESRTTLPNGAAMKGSQLTANWSNEVYTINYNSNKPGNASHDPSYV